jgi:glycerol-3-phosphate dehydrogenase (NAD(P)+)
MNSSTHKPNSNSHNKNLVVIGAGAWGSALAINLSYLFDKVFLICHEQKQTELQNHPALDNPYPQNVVLTTKYESLNDCDNILIATPSYAFFEVLNSLKPFIKSPKTTTKNIAWATKGFAGEKLLHQTFKETFKEILPNLNPCLISGPSFAKEVASLKPTALVVSSESEEVAKTWANLIKSPNLKTYISTDIIGCEVGGAVKNILAIAAGVSSGLGFGTNTMSALITRGLAEMTRFGESLGAKNKTFMGLTGLGDLTLTCLDDKSRNRSFGKLLAKYNDKEKALIEVGATVEGLNALPVVLKIAKDKNVKMPICESVGGILSGKITAKTAVNNLMLRDSLYE